MGQAFSVMDLTARGYHRIIKTARTIADLDGEDQIRTEHLREALGYRTVDNNTGKNRVWERRQKMKYEYWLARIRGISAKKKGCSENT